MKYKFSNINWYNFSSVLISIIALIVSINSCSNSQETFEYQKSKDALMNTPAIKESLDTNFVYFNLNNDHSELQGLSITFPPVLEKSPIKLLSKPIKFSKSQLEFITERFLKENLVTKDSVAIVGRFTIPTMISYSAVVFGDSQYFRENRYLVYRFIQSDKEIKVEYKNSFLISRYGYPMKGHYFWYNPFTETRNEIIEKQDSIDVAELLNWQFKNIQKDQFTDL